MKWQKVQPVLIIIIFFIALALRLPQLTLRPMHGDEAVNAVKFAQLLERGNYIYDPQEYHGPTLYYFTLISTWIGGIDTFKNLSEFSLRIIPVIFGLLIILSLIYLKKDLDKSVMAISILFLAISPFMVYYNRYFIHESLLVFFSWGIIVTGYVYSQKRNWLTAIVMGIFLGLTISTKETWVIYVFAAVSTLASLGKFRNAIKELNLKHVMIAICTMLVVIILFYSSFFTNIQGVSDAISAYKNYIIRAGSNDLHNHPWFYYIGLLTYFKMQGFPQWSEALIIFLAFIGFILIITRRTESVKKNYLLKFIAIYTALLMFVFSLIPYKTPWNFLGVMPGLIIIAAFALKELGQLLYKPAVRFIGQIVVLAAIIHLLWQSFQLNYIYYAHPANPYVYAHPTEDVYKIKAQIDEVVSGHPDGYDLHIQVIAGGNDYWPLPWYLRACNRIGWWDHIPDKDPVAPLIIVNAKLESALIRRLYEVPPPGKRDLYLPLFDSYTELRPGIELRAYIKKEDWDLVNTSH